MNYHRRLQRLEEQARAQEPAPLPSMLQELLPHLENLAPEARDRVLHKEWARLELRMGFVGHVLPGAFTLDLTPEEIERAVQVMLNVAHPDTPSPRDVDPGDIEEVARQKTNANNQEMYERRQSFGPDTTAGALALLKPETGDLLKAEALVLGYCRGGDWEFPAPWIDMGGSPNRWLHRANGRPIRGQRRRP